MSSQERDGIQNDLQAPGGLEPTQWNELEAPNKKTSDTEEVANDESTPETKTGNNVNFGVIIQR